MGGKKIKSKLASLLKTKTIPNSIKLETAPNMELRDLKHDLENQLIKIQQRLEYLKGKVHAPSKTLREQYIDICTEYQEDAGGALIFIDRLVNQMFCEIACLTIIDGKSEKIAEYRNKFSVPVHKIVLRTSLLYGEELRKNHIHTDILPSTERWEVSEYVFSGIILKILENCAKYCKPYSQVKIQIGADKIIFKMKSLKIEYSERNKIFENGFSGKHTVNSGKNSTGKGLYHAKKLAEFHDLALSVTPGACDEECEGLIYSDNEFILSRSL